MNEVGTPVIVLQPGHLHYLSQWQCPLFPSLPPYPLLPYLPIPYSVFPLPSSLFPIHYYCSLILVPGFYSLHTLFTPYF